MSISSLIGAKRIHNAIDAMGQLPAAIKNRMVYHVVGDGPDMASLKLRAKSEGINSVFYGNLPHDRAMQMLAGMDFLIHPSSFETFGVVLAEAMAVGLPVIATRCGGPEFLVSEGTGTLVAVDDVSALTVAIQQLISCLSIWRGKSADISEYARFNFHENYIADLIAREYL
jgi:glycosyltransferase involved in cell wall biosynthesis